MPAVYIVRYSIGDEGYKVKYSSKGKILETNHLNNLSVLPYKALELIQKGTYKDWEVVGDVLEIPDNTAEGMVGYVVTIEKRGDKKRIYFNRDGDVVRIQELT